MDSNNFSVDKCFASNIMVATKKEIKVVLDSIKKEFGTSVNDPYKNISKGFISCDDTEKFIIFFGSFCKDLVVFRKYNHGIIALTEVNRCKVYEDGVDMHLVLRYSDKVYESVQGFNSYEALVAWVKEPYKLDFLRKVTNSVEQYLINQKKIDAPTLQADFLSAD